MRKGIWLRLKTVDPLFVLDLDRNNPQILGELKIPGWSDYLHPLDQDHLLGFGREVDPNAGDDGRFTWDETMGIKLSIFDVSDVSNPIEEHKYIIGERGTESQLLHNHKALMWDAGRNTLAFPINISEKVSGEKCGTHTYSSCPSTCQQVCVPSVCSEDGICTSDCDGPTSCRAQNESIRQTFSGAIVFDVSLDNGFTERGRITNYNASHFERGYLQGDWAQQIQRVLYIDDVLYAVAQEIVGAYDFDSLVDIEKLKLK